MKSLDRAGQNQKQPKPIISTTTTKKTTQKMRGVPNEMRYMQSGKLLRREGRVVC